MLDVNTLVDAANHAKRLAGEIELLDGINVREQGAYIALRRRIGDEELLSREMLSDVLEKGLTALRNIKSDQLLAVLCSVQQPLPAVNPPPEDGGQ
jgi:hypothetical protein